MRAMGLMLIGLGIVVTLVGMLIYFGPSIPFIGKLPGDIRIERGNFQFYFPIATCILLSVLLSILFFIVSRLR